MTQKRQAKTKTKYSKFVKKKNSKKFINKKMKNTNKVLITAET